MIQKGLIGVTYQNCRNWTITFDTEYVQLVDYGRITINIVISDFPTVNWICW